MSLWEPPRDVDPGELFRLLLTFPRPTLPIEHRIAGAESIGLHVRALRSAELGWALGGADELPTEVRASAIVAKLLTVAVCTSDGVPAFGTSDDVGSLPEMEAVALLREVDAGLRIISPTYLAADHDAWRKALKRGAMATSNLCDALALGGCYDVSWGFGKRAVHLRDEPERYFGCAQRELLDCHWMAFRAAQAFKIDLDRRAS